MLHILQINQPPIANKASTAPIEQTYLGLKQSEIITSIIVPTVLAILTVWFAVWLSRKWRDKVRVRVASKLNDRDFGQFSALYCDRVQHYERIPPSHIRAFLRREHSAKSLRNFRNRTKSSTYTHRPNASCQNIRRHLRLSESDIHSEYSLPLHSLLSHFLYERPG